MIKERIHDPVFLTGRSDAVAAKIIGRKMRIIAFLDESGREAEMMEF